MEIVSSMISYPCSIVPGGRPQGPPLRLKLLLDCSNKLHFAIVNVGMWASRPTIHVIKHAMEEKLPKASLSQGRLLVEGIHSMNQCGKQQHKPTDEKIFLQHAKKPPLLRQYQ